MDKRIHCMVNYQRENLKEILTPTTKECLNNRTLKNGSACNKVQQQLPTTQKPSEKQVSWTYHQLYLKIGHCFAI